MHNQDEINKGAKAICFAITTALENDDGALIGRNGSGELDCMINGIKAYSIQTLESNAGIYPMRQPDTFLSWREESIKATQTANILVTRWYKPLEAAEQKALVEWNVTPIQIPLRSLEPYYVEDSLRWTSLLSGHRVAVITSFTETAKKQISKGVCPMFPSDISWSWIQTGHPPSVAQGRNEWPLDVGSWSDAVQYVVREVLREGARFALIGCGGLSMPIARALKLRGIIAIVLGGAIQVLFSIKGNRWKNHETIRTLWTNDWVFPSEEETPSQANLIEGGCYWG